MTATKKVRTLRRMIRGLYTWRNLELSLSENARPPWNLCYSGKNGRQRLPCGASDLQFHSKRTAARYLSQHGFAVEGVE